MFQKLLGGEALKNLIIVTNRWGEEQHRVSETREKELKTRDTFYKPVLDKGARMIRHDNTVPSAQEIIRLVLPPTSPGVPPKADSRWVMVRSSIRKAPKYRTVTIRYAFVKEK